MTSLKPYLIRSIYEWIIDNHLTPHLLVDAENFDSVLPEDYIEEGKIVLNVRPEAIQGLVLGNEEIQFDARFSVQPIHIVTPVAAILAIYARENGRGMVFDPEDYQDDDNSSNPELEQPKPGKPHLRVVK